MNNFIKATATAIIILGALSTSASAFDYQVKLNWNVTKTDAQNQELAAQKATKYCRIMVRRHASRDVSTPKAINHCVSQLMDDYALKTDKNQKTQQYALATKPKG